MKPIDCTDWPGGLIPTHPTRANNYCDADAPDFTPANFRYLIERFNDLAEEVEEMRKERERAIFGGPAS